jgi:hypothetical protein
MDNTEIIIYHNPSWKHNKNSKYLHRSKDIRIHNTTIKENSKDWKYAISRVRSSMDKKLGKNDMCRDSIPKEFFDKEYMLEDTNIIFIMTDKLKTRHKSNSMVAFSLCNDLNLEENKKDGLYLDAICGQGYGSKLIDIIEQYSKLKKFKFIKLSALSYVINYYRNKGYRHRKKCSMKEGQASREERIPILADLNRKKKFKNDEDVIEWEEDEDENVIKSSIQEKDPEFIYLLKLLSSRGYSVNCDEVGKYPSSTRTYPLLKNKCLDEGFTMIKCLKDKRKMPPCKKYEPPPHKEYTRKNRRFCKKTQKKK